MGHYLNQWDKLLASREILIMNRSEHRIDPKWTLINWSQLTTGSKNNFLRTES